MINDSGRMMEGRRKEGWCCDFVTAVTVLTARQRGLTVTGDRLYLFIPAILLLTCYIAGWRIVVPVRGKPYLYLVIIPLFILLLLCDCICCIVLLSQPDPPFGSSILTTPWLTYDTERKEGRTFDGLGILCLYLLFVCLCGPSSTTQEIQWLSGYLPATHWPNVLVWRLIRGRHYYCLRWPSIIVVVCHYRRPAWHYWHYSTYIVLLCPWPWRIVCSLPHTHS